MTIARALVRDLVDKRLWPVAVLLVAALIAVPLLLAGGGSAGKPVPAAAIDADTSATASRSVPAVELVGPPSVRSRPGTVRDPFRRPKPKAVKASADTPPPGTQTTAADPGSASSIPVVRATPAPEPFAYRTEVRFGSTEGDAPKARGISRLTPFGGLIEPALMYLGVSPDGTHATFLLGPTAQQNGEGRCVDVACRIKLLKAGDSMVVDVTPAAGQPRQYALDVVSVKREEMRSERAASAARARVHPDGRDVLRELIRDSAAGATIGKIVFDQSRGLLTSKSAP
jgi:hypothetical protein